MSASLCGGPHRTETVEVSLSSNVPWDGGRSMCI